MRGLDRQCLLQLQLIRRVVEGEVEFLDEHSQCYLSFLPGERAALEAMSSSRIAIIVMKPTYDACSHTEPERLPSVWLHLTLANGTDGV